MSIGWSHSLYSCETWTEIEESFINQRWALFGRSVNYSRSLGFRKVCVTPKKGFWYGSHQPTTSIIILHRFGIALFYCTKSYKMFNEVLQLPFIMASTRYKSQWHLEWEEKIEASWVGATLPLSPTHTCAFPLGFASLMACRSMQQWMIHFDNFGVRIWHMPNLS